MTLTRPAALLRSSPAALPAAPGPGPELVVLLDEDGRSIGTARKATVHTATTPLHRAFSCYLFDPHGLLLLTRRAATKTAFPGMWTNSVCGHPAPGESDQDAIARRADAELGLPLEDLTLALPDFRYRAEHDGIVENEVCPVYLARTAGTPSPHPDEVDQHAWKSWTAFRAELDARPSTFSPWSREQAAQLHLTPHLARYQTSRIR